MIRSSPMLTAIEAALNVARDAWIGCAGAIEAHPHRAMILWMASVALTAWGAR